MHSARGAPAMSPLNQSAPTASLTRLDHPPPPPPAATGAGAAARKELIL